MVLANMHLVILKGTRGLKYREIDKLPEFAALKMNALGSVLAMNN
jgi:hypothetical protein